VATGINDRVERSLGYPSNGTMRPNARHHLHVSFGVEERRRQVLPWEGRHRLVQADRPWREAYPLEILARLRSRDLTGPLTVARARGRDPTHS
jgi:hypothetical protein